MEIRTVTINDVDFDVEYIVNGKFIPSTWYEPAEYPEVEIVDFYPTDLDLYNEVIADEGLTADKDEQERLLYEIITKQVYEEQNCF